MSRQTMKRCALAVLVLAVMTCLAGAAYRWHYRRTVRRMVEKGDALYGTDEIGYAVLVENVVAKALYGPKWAGGWELLFRYALEHQASPMASSIMEQMVDLERREQGMKLARELLSSSNPSVRAEAARVVLTAGQGTIAIRVLRKLMHDAPLPVRQNATRILGYAGHWEAVEQLRDWVVSGPGGNEETRYTWVIRLGVLTAAGATDEPVLRVCREVIRKTVPPDVGDGSEAAWSQAARTLIMVRDQEGVAILADMLRAGPEEAAYDAFVALSLRKVLPKDGRRDLSPAARKKAAERVREWLQKQDR